MIPWNKQDEGPEVHLNAQGFSSTGNNVVVRLATNEKGALLVFTVTSSFGLG
jgi:hypothetical protein